MHTISRGSSKAYHQDDNLVHCYESPRWFFVPVGFLWIYTSTTPRKHHGLLRRTGKKKGWYPTRKKRQPSADLDLLATPPHDFGNILDIYLALLPWVGISHKQTKKRTSWGMRQSVLSNNLISITMAPSMGASWWHVSKIDEEKSWRCWPRQVSVFLKYVFFKVSLPWNLKIPGRWTHFDKYCSIGYFKHPLRRQKGIDVLRGRSKGQGWWMCSIESTNGDFLHMNFKEFTCNLVLKPLWKYFTKLFKKEDSGPGSMR